MGVCRTEFQARTSHQTEGPPPGAMALTTERRAGEAPSGSLPPAFLEQEHLQ